MAGANKGPLGPRNALAIPASPVPPPSPERKQSRLLRQLGFFTHRKKLKTESDNEFKSITGKLDRSVRVSGLSSGAAGRASRS